MGPTWDPLGSCWPQMSPMLAPRILLSGILLMQNHFSYVPHILFCHNMESIAQERLTVQNYEAWRQRLVCKPLWARTYCLSLVNTNVTPLLMLRLKLMNSERNYYFMFSWRMQILKVNCKFDASRQGYGHRSRLRIFPKMGSLVCEWNYNIQQLKGTKA